MFEKLQSRQRKEVKMKKGYKRLTGRHVEWKREFPHINQTSLSYILRIMKVAVPHTPPSTLHVNG